MSEPTRPCNSHERLFCEAISIGMKPSQAAKHAGWKEPYRRAASNALRRPCVKAYLEKLQKKASKQADITRADVLEGLKEAIYDAKLGADPQSQIAGWREIGKIIGIYAPEEKKILVESDKLVALAQLESLPESRLLELAGEEALEGEFSLIDEDDDEAESFTGENHATH